VAAARIDDPGGGSSSALAVVLGVMLARLAGVVGGMRGMAMRGVRVMAGLLVIVRRVVGSRLAVVFGGMLVVLCRSVMVLDNLVLGHRILLGCGRDGHRPGGTDLRSAMLQPVAR
jgi:hypothetical protein